MFIVKEVIEMEWKLQIVSGMLEVIGSLSCSANVHMFKAQNSSDKVSSALLVNKPGPLHQYRQ